MKFSVLITTYYKEKPDNLRRSLCSIIQEQTVKPDQVVLVLDGPVGEQLEAVVGEYEREYTNFDVVRLQQNMGQSGASEAGLKYCKYELIARMDSDDISEPDRFEKELKIFEENPLIDVVGAWIGEFYDDETKITKIRCVPEMDYEIKKRFRFRNPINNVSVMMKKKTILDAGAYSEKSANEDYSLYVQMFINGAFFYNIPQILVRVRTGNGMTVRRNDMNIFFDWRKDQIKLLKSHNTSIIEYFVSCLGCFFFVVMPYSIKEKIYQLFLRKRVKK